MILRSNDFIRINTSAGKAEYQRTEAGRQFLKLYSKMALMLDPGVSAPSLIW
jgi:predicted transcriptional regulator